MPYRCSKTHFFTDRINYVITMNLIPRTAQNVRVRLKIGFVKTSRIPINVRTIEHISFDQLFS